MEHSDRIANNWARSGEAKRAFRVSGKTLIAWANRGQVESIALPGPGKRVHRLYNLASFVPSCDRTNTRRTGCDEAKLASVARDVCIYARVSTRKQAGDLQRQIDDLRNAHPNANRVFSDIASGVNFKRKGLRSLIDHALAGRVAVVYVSPRDRLCRFAFDLMEHVLHQCGAALVVESHDLDATSPVNHTELVDDIVSVVTSFGARLYGSRSRGRRRTAGVPQDAS